MRQFQTLFNEQIVLRSLLLWVWETEVLKNYRFELKIVFIYVNLGLNKTIIFNCQIHTENNLNKYIYSTFKHHASNKTTQKVWK